MTVAYAFLRAAALLAPAADRDRWLAEWRSELWYIPREQELSFCLGAFRDAVEVRRQRPATPRLVSHWHCLAFLALLGVVCLGLLAGLAGPLQAHTTLWRLPARQ